MSDRERSQSRGQDDEQARPATESKAETEADLEALDDFSTR